MFSSRHLYRTLCVQGFRQGKAILLSYRSGDAGWSNFKILLEIGSRFTRRMKDSGGRKRQYIGSTKNTGVRIITPGQVARRDSCERPKAKFAGYSSITSPPKNVGITTLPADRIGESEGGGGGGVVEKKYRRKGRRQAIHRGSYRG
ncbi:uncharacterized protein LOC118645670 isoform X2 [Monomorium pharaonis]|nr:uncharacterized protein LOC118645670 isoform X2 [Monomorium pharaonis]